MPNYAIYDGNEIVNVIVAESVEDAEELTSMQCFDLEEIKITTLFSYIDGETGETIEVVNDTYPAIGWKKINNEWVGP